MLTSPKGIPTHGAARSMSHENRYSVLILDKDLWIEVVCRAKSFISRYLRFDNNGWLLHVKPC